jgi:hypothetical protein
MENFDQTMMTLAGTWPMAVEDYDTPKRFGLPLGDQVLLQSRVDITT